MAADDMHNEQDQASSDAPPTETAGPQLPELPSRWPTVFGVVAIVFAGLGIFFGGNALLSILRYEPPPNAAGQTPTVPPMVIINVLLSIGLAVLLLISGIGLMKRRACAPKWLTRWAVVYIIYAVVNGILNFYAQRGPIAAMSSTTQPTGIPGGSPMTFFVIAFVLGLVWACAFPVLLLIWFSRKSIKAEVAQWSGAESTDVEAPPTQ